MTVNTNEIAPALFKTEGLALEEQRMRTELVAAARQIKSTTELAFATDLDIETAEVLATQLVAQKDIGDAKLSYALHVLKENRAFLNAGYDTFHEYVEAKIQISAPKASALASRWQMFTALGLSTNVLTGPNAISWSKFGELAPGVKAGIVTQESIDLWLPLLTSDGPFAITNSGISKFIKAEIANSAAEEDPEQMENMTIRTTADNKAHMQRYISTIQEATGMLGAGDVVVAALEAKVTEVATNSADIRANYGLARFKEIAERMADVQVVFLADSKHGYTKEALGVVPYTRLYTDAPITARCVLAADDDEAKAILGDTVYSIPIELMSDTEEAPAEDVVVYEEVVEEAPVTVTGLNTTSKEIAAELLAKKVVTKADIAALKEKAIDAHGTDKLKVAKEVNAGLRKLALDANLAI